MPFPRVLVQNEHKSASGIQTQYDVTVELCGKYITGTPFPSYE